MIISLIACLSADCYLAPCEQKQEWQGRGLIALGIESSCDDTCAAVVTNPPSLAPAILANTVASQHDLHAAYGGVVPEIAARAHAEKLDLVIKQALRDADVTFAQIDLIAVTAGPGLIGGLLSGLNTAKALALATGKPLIAVNHLAGHALTPTLSDDLPFPYLLLLVSGGHCQFIGVFGHSDFMRLGGTIDDAPGEAFDKVAKLLSLPQPGGPAVEQAGLKGNPKRFALPRPLLGKDGSNMSFSGLKTALRRARDELMGGQNALRITDQQDLCASFQAAVVDVLAAKSRVAFAQFEQACAARDLPYAPRFAVAGGVAANTAIRGALTALAADQSAQFVAPPLALCTDNGAMIAWAGLLQYRAGARSDLTATARARWPLDADASPMLGSGKRGAKA